MSCSTILTLYYDIETTSIYRQHSFCYIYFYICLKTIIYHVQLLNLAIYLVSIAKQITMDINMKGIFITRLY